MIEPAKALIRYRITELTRQAQHNEDQADDLRKWAATWANKAAAQRAEAAALQADLDHDADESSGWRDAVVTKAVSA